MLWASGIDLHVSGVRQIDPQVIGPARVFGRSRLATALGAFVRGA